MAGSPGGQIIGKVAVKVVPDTSKFRGEAQRDLNKIEKTLKVHVEAKIDESGLKRDALLVVQRLNKTLRSNSAYHVRFRAVIAKTTMPQAISKAAREMEAIAKTRPIKFHADITGTIAEVKGELDKESLKVVQKELEDWRDNISPLSVHIKTEMLAGTTTGIAARLRYLTRPRTVQIIPVLNSTATAKVATALAALSGARMVGNIFDKIADALKNLDKNIPIIGTLAEAIAGLAAYALTGASNLFALSRSIAQIGPAALALPGIFGGIAIGLGATVAVMKDFNTVIPEVKQQMADLQDQMSENFWAVAEQPIRNMIGTLLPQLSAGLQKTSTELGGFFGALATSFTGVFNGALAGMFADLSASIAIFTGYTDDLANSIKVLGEVGAGYLPQLADYFGGLIEKFNDFISKAQADGSLSRWIETGIFQMQELGRATGNLGGILRGLAIAAENAGGSTLTAFADTLQRVETVVKGNTFQTALTGALKAAHDSMSTIANISGPAFETMMLNLARLATSVFPTMGKTMGTAFKAIFDVLGSPAVTNGLQAMFEGIGKGVQGLVPAVGPVSKALGALFSLIGTMSSQYLPTLGQAFASMSPIFVNVVGALQPLINTLGPVLRSVMAAFAPLAAQWGQNFAKIIAAVQPLVAAIGDLIGLIAPVLVPVLKLVASIIGSAITGVIKGVTMVIQGVIQVVRGFIDVFKGVIQFFSGDFSGGLRTIWNGIKGIFLGALKAIAGAIWAWLNGSILGVVRGGLFKLLGMWKGGWAGIKSAAVSVWNAIKSFLVGGWNVLKTLFSNGARNLKLIWGAAWTAIKNVASTVWAGIKAVVTTYINAVRAVINGVLMGIRAIWNGGWQGVKAVLVAAWNAMVSAARNIGGNLLSFVRSIPGKVKSAFGAAKSLLTGVGADMIRGLIAGIASMAGAVADKVGDIVSGAVSKAKSLLKIKSPSRVFMAIGRFVGEGFAKGIVGTTEHVQKTMDRLMDKVRKTGKKGLINLVNDTRSALLKKAGAWESLTARIEKQKDKIKRAYEEMRDYAKGVADRIIEAGNIANAKGEEDAPVTFDIIKQQLHDAVKQARDFRDALKKLEGLGLNKTSFDQIAQAGPDALAVAEAIAAEGKAGVEQINELQKQLNNAANAAGEVAVDAMFTKVGIQTAQGIIDGLREKRKDLEAEMRSLARVMVNTIKRELGIKSPSRVFAELGGYVGQGFSQGINREETRVQRAMEGMAAIRPSNIAGRIGSSIDGSLGTGVVQQKVLNYYAAPGSSLGAEEDLFAAAERSRMVGW